MKPGLLLFVLALAAPALAQVDSTYIGDFRQDFSISVSAYRKFTSIVYDGDGHDELRYTPNTPVGIGLGVVYRNFSLKGGIGFGFMRDQKRGKTRSLDFQYHYYGRKFVADLFFQNYHGFYTEKNENDIEFFPDIRLTQYGGSLQYVFRHRKFSHRAAFYQREKQLKSTGSFQLGGGMYYSHLSADSSLVINEWQMHDNYQINVTGGYAHTFVIKRDFFISADVSLGVSLSAENPRYLFKKIDLAPSLLVRVSAGYNADKWSVGLNVVINRLLVLKRQDMNLYFDTGRMNMVFIRRFDSAPAFLRKIKWLNK